MIDRIASEVLRVGGRTTAPACRQGERTPSALLDTVRRRCLPSSHGVQRDPVDSHHLPWLALHDPPAGWLVSATARPAQSLWQALASPQPWRDHPGARAVAVQAEGHRLTGGVVGAVGVQARPAASDEDCAVWDLGAPRVEGWVPFLCRVSPVAPELGVYLVANGLPSSWTAGSARRPMSSWSGAAKRRPSSAVVVAFNGVFVLSNTFRHRSRGQTSQRSPNARRQSGAGIRWLSGDRRHPTVVGHRRRAEGGGRCGSRVPRRL